ncbi:MAG: PstS family phosphate ABC transporter substrate-binding protein [Cyanobium sp.]|nr:PstS family phosphate ABC transporter substrate-binding protein [Cyanobium sp.]
MATISGRTGQPRRWQLGGLLTIGVLPMFLSALAPDDSRAQSRPASAVDGVKVGGSSTVFPIVEQAVRRFQEGGRNRDIRIDLQETGTSAGLRRFCAGAIPLANASRPINTRELNACKARGITFIELPIAFDAITVAVHPSNRWASQISTAELRRLWNRQAQGRVTRWSQVNKNWPDRPIKLCGPGEDSGTFDYFNQAINGNVDDSRKDYTASEDDNVLVRCVASNPNALGYFGFAYYAANRGRLKALPIRGLKGVVAPSIQTVQQEKYLPLSRPLFLYVNDKELRQDQRLRRFLTFLVQNGLQLVEQVRFVPLPGDTYRLVEAKLYRHVLGSAFGGDLPVGQGINQSLRLSLDSVRRASLRNLPAGHSPGTPPAGPR